MSSQEMDFFVVLADKAADNALKVIEDLREQLRAASASKAILMDRIGKADAARDQAIQEMSAYARRCGELEAQLCGQLVEYPALALVLQELTAAKAKYPIFATGVDQGFAVLMRESGELADALIKRDIHGQHGVIREAAQVAAVAMRIIEKSMEEVPHAHA